MGYDELYRPAAELSSRPLAKQGVVWYSDGEKKTRRRHLSMSEKGKLSKALLYAPENGFDRLP